MKRSTAIALILLTAPTFAAAQQDTSRIPTGVELATRYTVQHKVALAVRPFEGPPALGAIEGQIREILQRDLDYSDRFNLVPVPERLASGAVEYALWNNLNVVWLLTGGLTVSGDGYALALTLHDVVYQRERQSRTFLVPTTTSPGFRMAVHAIADDIVRWISGQPGAAATQVVFTRQNPGGSSDLLIVDSDGENLRRLAGSEQTIYSPVWAPDGRRIAFSMFREGAWELLERDVASGAMRALHRGSTLMTPAYAPDGRRVLFAMWSGNATVLHEYDAERRSVRRLTTGPAGRIDMAPAFSPAGDRIAFLSNRLGSPHIFIMAPEGGAAQTLSPFVAGERAEFYAPSWSPVGTQVVFHGRSRGQFQIMLADVARMGAPVQQLTARGRNEDPSFAPDGRHVVFSAAEGLGGGPPGLYVIDTVTGRTRLLVRGARLRMADWSPPLVRSTDLAAAGR